MKKFIYSILFIIIFPSVVFSMPSALVVDTENNAVAVSDIIHVDFTNDIRIKKCEKHDCVEIKTRNNTIRVYECGKVEKLDWKELNPNEDTQTFSGWSSVSLCLDSSGNIIECEVDKND